VVRFGSPRAEAVAAQFDIVKFGRTVTMKSMLRNGRSIGYACRYERLAGWQGWGQQMYDRVDL